MTPAELKAARHAIGLSARAFRRRSLGDDPIPAQGVFGAGGDMVALAVTAARRAMDGG